ncbi:hypothetical protein BDA99DRAFT_602379 [Phascolomyces articulosus]|uniref:Uncharacterized protein n=1 Tax=Phascolomyces articulosus TaxID=60185 RepID=A0AAD5KHU3_9FUNG|nr:hypothetical protein BDA99DRAFT_602379 [Phascolomyces articulosus]
MLIAAAAATATTASDNSSTPQQPTSRTATLFNTTRWDCVGRSPPKICEELGRGDKAPVPLSVVKEGYQLQFSKTPVPWFHRSVHRSVVEQTLVDQAVQKFLNAKVIELSPSQDRCYLSTFFSIQEPTFQDGGYFSIERLTGTERPDGKNRPERYLHSCPYSSKLSQYHKECRGFLTTMETVIFTNEIDERTMAVFADVTGIYQDETSIVV